MIPMSNPLMAMMQMARAGGNPMILLQQMAGQNPQVAQMANMMQGKSPQQLRTMAENMARERGTTPEEVARQIGITIPKN